MDSTTITVIISIVLVVAVTFYFLQQQAVKPYNYKIIVLGPTGAGKTVFLASMFSRLEGASGDRPFFLTTTLQQRAQLLQYIDRIRNTQDEFPAPTQFFNVTEWKFTCQIKASSGIYELVRFTYLDYAGGRIKQLRNPQQIDRFAQQFDTKLKEANIVLGLLDGQEILKVLQTKEEDDQTEVERFFRGNIDEILPYLQRCERPVHFIITKWDLLAKKGYKLEEVIARLEKHDRLKNFVDFQIRHDVLRFIPVSAVGMSFAELQDDGSMKKIPGGEYKPYLVEMPLACVLYDNLQHEIEQPSFNKQWLDYSKSPNSLKAMGMAFMKSLFSAVRVNIAGPFIFSVEVFLDSLGLLTGNLHPEDEIQPPKPGETRAEVTREAIFSFWRLMRNLEQQFPASKVGNRL